MEFTITTEENFAILKLNGSLLADIQSRDVLEGVNNIIQEGKINFIVDLSELKFINSSGLGMLLTCLTKARKAGGDLILANIPEQVSNLLVITKLTSVFTPADSMEEAKSKFES